MLSTKRRAQQSGKTSKLDRTVINTFSRQSIHWHRHARVSYRPTYVLYSQTNIADTGTGGRASGHCATIYPQTSSAGETVVLTWPHISATLLDCALSLITILRRLSSPLLLHAAPATNRVYDPKDAATALRFVCVMDVTFAMRFKSDIYYYNTHHRQNHNHYHQHWILHNRHDNN